MTPKPDLVLKADRLLELAETVADHESRAKQLIDAINMLNAYLRENPSSEHRGYIENRKVSHIRTHLKSLLKLKEPDQLTWFFNFCLFAVAAPEVSRALEQHPELTPSYEAFKQSQVEWAKNEIEPLSQGVRSNE